MTSFCEHADELLDTIKAWDFLTSFPKEEFAQCVSLASQKFVFPVTFCCMVLQK
jgi:hypothetical protein